METSKIVCNILVPEGEQPQMTQDFSFNNFRWQLLEQTDKYTTLGVGVNVKPCKPTDRKGHVPVMLWNGKNVIELTVSDAPPLRNQIYRFSFEMKDHHKIKKNPAFDKDGNFIGALSLLGKEKWVPLGDPNDDLEIPCDSNDDIYLGLTLQSVTTPEGWPLAFFRGNRLQSVTRLRLKMYCRCTQVSLKKE